MAFDIGRWSTALPVAEAVPELRAALAVTRAAVLQAPPGAGKTTLVPLVLLKADWLGGRRILMLEPRRLAARAAARRMAEMLGESVGETVGYRTRFESRIGPRTRVEVLTEGILLRLLDDDPALEGAGLVVFDEFHERSLDGDLGLALTLDARRHLRPDLAILVMSATLDGAGVARLLEDAPVIASAGRSHEVALTYLGRPAPEHFDRAIVAAILRALDETEGGILVFLPGGAEIRRAERQLRSSNLGPDIIVAPLYGDLPQGAQDFALRPPPSGRRKIVLATSIAETSLTIEAIRAVIDGGLMRVPLYEPASGMTRLETVRVSHASSEQRRGRAGRLAPGRCYRVWREAEQAQLAPYTKPEILQGDLAGLALALARWGNGDPAAYSWLDAPPAPAFAEARKLLHRLGALDAAGSITQHGHAMAGFGLPPRLSHMIVRGKAWGLGALACALAAVLVERDLVKAAPGTRDADLRLRLELVLERDAVGDLPDGISADRPAIERARQAARRYARLAGVRGEEKGLIAACGRLVAQAYPDRVAQRRADAAGQFRLANGRGASLRPSDKLAAEEFLAVAHLDGDRRDSRIFLAAPLDRAELETDFDGQIEVEETIAWSAQEEAVVTRRERRLEALVIGVEPLARAPAEAVAAALAEGIRSLGLGILPWQGAAQRLRDRIRFLARLDGQSGWPDLSDAALLANLETWLGPYLVGIRRRAQIETVDLADAIGGLLRPDQQRLLDRLAPTHVTVPSGSRLPIDYGAGEMPVLAVRLQEMFGAQDTPAIVDGRVPLLLHLLSPARRPLQVTRDLASFWRSVYPELRRTLRGRYPRHSWPEQPLEAVPTARLARRAPPGR